MLNRRVFRVNGSACIGSACEAPRVIVCGREKEILVSRYAQYKYRETRQQWQWLGREKGKDLHDVDIIAEVGLENRRGSLPAGATLRLACLWYLANLPCISPKHLNWMDCCFFICANTVPTDMQYNNLELLLSERDHSNRPRWPSASGAALRRVSNARKPCRHSQDPSFAIHFS